MNNPFTESSTYAAGAKERQKACVLYLNHDTYCISDEPFSLAETNLVDTSCLRPVAPLSHHSTMSDDDDVLAFRQAFSAANEAIKYLSGLSLCENLDMQWSSQVARAQTKITDSMRMCKRALDDLSDLVQYEDRCDVGDFSCRGRRRAGHASQADSVPAGKTWKNASYKHEIKYKSLKSNKRFPGVL
jgi:hypothetical protein